MVDIALVLLKNDKMDLSIQKLTEIGINKIIPMKTKRTVKNKKQKGTYAERELVKMFWGAGFAAMRAAGSGNTPLPCPDVIASNGQLTFAVECKSYSSDYIHLRWEQISGL